MLDLVAVGIDRAAVPELDGETALGVTLRAGAADVESDARAHGRRVGQRRASGGRIAVEHFEVGRLVEIGRD